MPTSKPPISHAGSVAVIGYDYLFPRPLALALQACGLQLVAAQERMLTAYFRNFNIIVDRYLVAGPAVAKQIAENPFCARFADRLHRLMAIGFAE